METEIIEFDKYNEWQIAISDAKVDRIFCSAWKSGDMFYLQIYK